MPRAAISGSMTMLSFFTPKSVSRMVICLARLMSRLENAMSGVVVGHRRGGDGLVVPLLGLAQQQPLLRRDVAHRLQGLGVLLLLPAAVDDQRDLDRRQYLHDGLRGLLGGGVRLLRVGRQQFQADEVRAVLLHPGLGPLRRVLDGVAEELRDRLGQFVERCP